MTIDDDPAILNPRSRYVRLGYLTPFESDYVLTVGDHTGGTKRGVKLTPTHFELISSLDPTVNDRQFTNEELGLLGWLAGQGFIALIADDAHPDEFAIIPVPRQEMSYEEILTEGYRVRAGDNEPFFVSELGARFLSLIDGQRTLGQIAEKVKENLLSDPEGRVSVLQNESEYGRTLNQFLSEEAFGLIQSALTSGAITFEPTA